MDINEKLINVICCPACKGSLRKDEDGHFLVCDKCKIKYPVKDGIPILLTEEGISFDQKDNC